MKVYTQPMVRGRVDDLVFCVCGTMYYARRYVKPRITEHNIALGNKVRIAMRLYKELSEVTMARLQQHTNTLNKQEPYQNGKGITRSSAWLQLFFRFMERHPEISWETVTIQDIEPEGDIIIPMLCNKTSPVASSRAETRDPLAGFFSYCRGKPMCLPR